MSSTLQSIQRERPTEIDYLNGEVVRLGRELGIPTSLNARVVELVHDLEHTHQFLTPGELNSGARSQVRLRSRDVEPEHHVAL